MVNKSIIIGIIMGIILNIALFMYTNYGAVCYEGCPFYPDSIIDFLIMGIILVIPTVMGQVVSTIIQKSTAHPL